MRGVRRFEKNWSFRTPHEWPILNAGLIHINARRASRLPAAASSVRMHDFRVERADEQSRLRQNIFVLLIHLIQTHLECWR